MPFDPKEALYDALHAPIGIILQCENPDQVRQALYRARREAMDEGLAALQIKIIDGQVWIVRTTKDAP